MDLVGTCPMTEWSEWLEEGDCAGDPDSGQTYWWNTRDWTAKKARQGARLYVVAHGRLRGFAIVRSVIYLEGGDIAIVRAGSAVPVTLPDPVPGFRGLKARWWKREDEIPFPDWKTAGVTTEEQRRELAAQKRARERAEREAAKEAARQYAPTLF